MPTVQQTKPIGSPPAFPGPIMLSPSSMPPGGAPFMPTEFAPANLALAGNIKAPEESKDNSARDKDPIGPGNQLVSSAAQVMAMPNPAIMQGPPRPGMPPLQPPPGMPNSHMHPFPSHQNMQHMPRQMMQGGPMYAERFRMSMPFPPRGPPVQQYLPVGPGVMNDRDMGHFRTVRPGFRCPPFPRGRW